MNLIFTILAVFLNLTASPDSTLEAFSREGDLYIRSTDTQTERRLTLDGSKTILNGRASWVYYEEIFGRSSDYKAFWWSPDSKKLAFYRFDETDVTLFPIFSPFGQNGNLKLTRYPKAGQTNPGVKVGIVDVETGWITWARFPQEDQYFGPPFWSDDSKRLFVQREPRRQNRLELYSVRAFDGEPDLVYQETYKTWVNWIDGMLFAEDGIYMARDFESGWEQIYFLSYDGKTFKCLSGGENWDINLLAQVKGRIWFTARRGSKVHPAVYRLERGHTYALTPEEFWARDASVQGREIFVCLSTASSPWRRCRYDAFAREPKLLSDEPLEPAVDLNQTPVAELIRIQHDGYDLYGLISYPKDFDPEKRYPLIMEVYGGPGTAYVRDRWKDRDATDAWAWNNGVIWICVDPRSSGENGRCGMDEAFRRMTVVELQDYIAWARFLGSLPYVDKDRIGVDGFSFGGTTTAMLVLRYPEYFRCGIAGGGVYDWTLYDSHYTERFMDTPQANPDGYREASVIAVVENGGVSPDYRPYSLKLTHGTGDDNVHFQNTLQLLDALQRQGIQFEFMVYPDGMHGYRGLQRVHDKADAAAFWKKNLF